MAAGGDDPTDFQDEKIDLICKIQKFILVSSYKKNSKDLKKPKNKKGTDKTDSTVVVQTNKTNESISLK